MTDTPILETRTLGAGYGGARVLDSLDLVFPRGRLTALLGPNGCGKSTLLRCLAGMHPRQTGTVLLDGAPIARQSPKALARRISILGQGLPPPEGLTVSELVAQGRYPHRSLLAGWTARDSEAVNDALRLTGLYPLRDRRVDTLSGGQRQRAWIAMTLAQQADVLLLDEPTSYLDLAHQIEVLGLVRDLVDTRQVSVVAVLHDLNQAARHADHVVLLKDGAVQARGAPAEVLTPALIARVFGVDALVIPDPETGAPLCIPRARTRAGE